MTPDQTFTHASQGVLVSGLFAGFGLAALVLILQGSKSFSKQVWFISGHQFFDVLTLALGLMIVLSVFGSITYADIAAGYHTEIKVLADRFLLGSFVVTLLALPLLIVPFSPVTAAILGGTEVIIFLLVGKNVR